MPESSRWLVTFLLNALWQVTVVALLASLCARLLRRARPGQVHLVWVLALAACVVVPCVTVIMQTRTSAPPGTASPPNPSTPALPVHAHRAGVVGFRALNRPVWLSPSLLGLALRIYLVLLSLRIARLTLLMFRTSRLYARAWPLPMTEDVSRTVRYCSQTLGLPPVPVLYSSAVRAPLTIGFRRPVVILPAGFIGSSMPDDLFSAVAHELAHIRRRDFGFNLLFEVASVPIWFHPGAALIRARLAQSRESACDEIASRLLDSPIRYASALVRLARLALPVSRPAPNYALGLFETNVLEERVMNLLRPAEAHSRVPRAARWTIALTAGLLTLGMSVFSLRLAAEDSNLQRFAGTWEAKYEGKTFFTLHLRPAGESLAGTAVHVTRVRIEDGELIPDTEETTTDKILEGRPTERKLLLKITHGGAASDTMVLEFKLVGDGEAETIYKPPDGPQQEKPWHFHRIGR